MQLPTLCFEGAVNDAEELQRFLALSVIWKRFHGKPEASCVSHIIYLKRYLRGLVGCQEVSFNHCITLSGNMSIQGDLEIDGNGEITISAGFA